jgi:mannose/fructose-specific phosphotransferase system component IIA
VVVAHGAMAEGLVSALTRVAGPQENVWALAADAPGSLADAIGGLLADRAAGREAVLFSDVDGGSCGQACRRLLARGVVGAVFHGVNLPMLFEFVFLQDRPFDQMVDEILTKSRRSIGVHP